MTESSIETMIYVVRGHKVMLDSDLANLYSVQTKNLNKAVKRNIEKFPADFMFKLTKDEFESLRFHFGTFKKSTNGRKYLPYVFTEYGIVALSGVLNSAVAVQINITIVRAFIRMRKVLSEGESISEKIEYLETTSNTLFKIVFERLELLEAELPVLPKSRKQIGFSQT